MAKIPKAKETQKAITAQEDSEVAEALRAVETPKILLSDVKAGSLVGEIREETVSFFHHAKEYEIDIRIKTLAFEDSDELHARMNNKEKVASEWMSKTLVDEKGELMFTEEQVGKTFVQPMASAIFDKVWGLDNVKKAVEKAKIKKD